MNINSYIKKHGHKSFNEHPLNDVDALIFAEFSYINFELLFKDGLFERAIKDIKLEELDNKAIFEGSVDANKNRIMLRNMINAPRYQDIVVKNIVSYFSKDEPNQFYALTLMLPDNTLYLSFRGTDTTLIGWREDFGIIYQDKILSQEQALNYTLEAVKDNNQGFYLGGHSKGGNLAFYVAFNIDKQYLPRFINAFSFDGPGFKNGIKDYPNYLEVESRLYKYLTHRDVIGMVFEDVNPHMVVYSNGFLLGGHDPFYWQVKGDGNFLTRKKVKQSAIRNNHRFSDWLSTLSIKDRIFFINTIFIVFNGNETIYDLFKNFISSLRRINNSLLEHEYSEKEKLKFKKITIRLVRFYMGTDDLKRMRKRYERKLENERKTQQTKGNS